MWLFGFISLGLNGFVDSQMNIILHLMLKLEKNQHNLHVYSVHLL